MKHEITILKKIWLYVLLLVAIEISIVILIVKIGVLHDASITLFIYSTLLIATYIINQLITAFLYNKSQINGLSIGLSILNNSINNQNQFKKNSEILRINAESVLRIGDGVLFPFIIIIGKIGVIIAIILFNLIIKNYAIFNILLITASFFIVMQFIIKEFMQKLGPRISEISNRRIGLIHECRRGGGAINEYKASGIWINKIDIYNKKLAIYRTINMLLQSLPKYIFEMAPIFIYVMYKLNFINVNFKELEIVTGASIYRLIPAIQLLVANLTSHNTNGYAKDEVNKYLINFENKYEIENILEPKLVYTKNGNNITINHVRECININGKKVNIPDFHVKSGDILLVKGKSGVGKTTYFSKIRNLINKKTEKTHGKFSDSNINILFVNQDSFVFEGTVLENILIGRDNNIRNYDYEKRLKIDEILTKKISSNADNLSGGERQRISLLRSLIAKADVYIYDEPNSALNLSLSTELANIFNELSKNNHIVIIITHSDIFDSVAKNIIYIE